MKVVAAAAFLPHVEVLSPIVATGAIARGLEGLYADVLREPMSEHMEALIRRLDGTEEGMRNACVSSAPARP